MRYTVVLDKDEESRGYTVTVPALPGCISQGKTKKEALKNIKEAILGYIECCQKAGEPVPKEEIVIDKVAV